jgi:hypothetical protein
VLQIVQTPDSPQSFALIRRHRGVDGRMTDTVLSRWPTRNSAHDALYDESKGIICGPGYTVPSEPIAITRRQFVRDQGPTAGVVALTALALIVGAFGFMTAGPSTTAAANGSAQTYIVTTLDR